MASTKVKKQRKHGVYPNPCDQQRAGRFCGGEIITWYHNGVERDAATKQIIPNSEYRIWTCRACGKELREPIGARRLYDPDNRRPDVSEFTQRICKDPYRAS